MISPSGPTLDHGELEVGLDALRALGLEPVLAPGALDVHGHLAGHDRQRADDLLWALGEGSVSAVWCARGGYGALRTVAALPAERLSALAAASPKPLIGFSDTTVLHALVGSVLGWVSYYGPSVVSLGRASSYTLAGVRTALFSDAAFSVAPVPDSAPLLTLIPGVAEGLLTGGCLTLLAALCGTPLQVDFRDRIAVIEDVNETPPRVERYLSQLLAAGCFEGVRGIAIGDFVGGRPDAASRARGGTAHTSSAHASEPASELDLLQVFADLLTPLGVPICGHFPIGHGPHRTTVPLGTLARLDADQRILEFPAGLS